MSSPQRRRELAARRAEEDEARGLEENRVANLSLYERIEEITEMHEVRAFLHVLVDRLDLY